MPSIASARLKPNGCGFERAPTHSATLRDRSYAGMARRGYPRAEAHHEAPARDYRGTCQESSGRSPHRLAKLRRFDEVLGREIDRARRTKLPLALILLDIDHFKLFNDAVGHLAGDDCLKAVAKTPERVIRRSAGIAAQFGGEGFEIILPETAESGAEQIAEKAIPSIRDLQSFHPGASIGKVTISAGLATLPMRPLASSAAESMRKLIHDADVCAVSSKRERTGSLGKVSAGE